MAKLLVLTLHDNYTNEVRISKLAKMQAMKTLEEAKCLSECSHGKQPSYTP